MVQTLTAKQTVCRTLLCRVLSRKPQREPTARRYCARKRKGSNLPTLRSKILKRNNGAGCYLCEAIYAGIPSVVRPTCGQTSLCECGDEGAAAFFRGTLPAKTARVRTKFVIACEWFSGGRVTTYKDGVCFSVGGNSRKDHRLAVQALKNFFV